MVLDIGCISMVAHGVTPVVSVLQSATADGSGDATAFARSDKSHKPLIHIA
jgi:hypothetical protein